MQNIQLHLGDCLEVLKTFDSNSLDSLVTDPPAGISFMGKDWDHHKGGRDQWIKWMSDVMTEALRVLKPGAHGLVWALPRTSHWTATALENAGFEVRDVITHLFGSGFPKSLDISKAIDKAAGKERTEIIGKKHCGLHHRGGSNTFTDDKWKAENRDGDYVNITAPSTPEAKQWQGFGTALKPASEHWILVRKPISEKTVAANVLKWGCGGLNIDGSRISSNGDHKRPFQPTNHDRDRYGKQSSFMPTNADGRFPANLILSHNPDCDDTCSEGCAVKELDDSVKGRMPQPAGNKKTSKIGTGINVKFNKESVGDASRFQLGGDPNTASRFFYCAKASKADRGEENGHPTVKATKLMSYLCRLVTPPNGTILDPFMGSGSTGKAAKLEGFKFVGIEQSPEYFEIAKKRLL